MLQDVPAVVLKGEASEQRYVSQCDQRIVAKMSFVLFFHFLSF